VGYYLLCLQYSRFDSNKLLISERAEVLWFACWRLGAHCIDSLSPFYHGGQDLPDATAKHNEDSQFAAAGCGGGIAGSDMGAAYRANSFSNEALNGCQKSLDSNSR
jgi:hypothetical protein